MSEKKSETVVRDIKRKTRPADMGNEGIRTFLT